MVYVVGAEPLQDERIASTARFGFIVPKSVGNAVDRNRVRRRLRAIAAEYVSAGTLAREPESGSYNLVTTEAAPRMLASGRADPPGIRQMVVIRMLAGSAQVPWNSLRSEVLFSFGRDADIQ